MRRAPASPVYPTYDRNDLEAPSYVIATPHGVAQGWCSGGPASAQATLDRYLASGTAVLYAWINPGPDFGGRADDARRAA